MKGLKDSLNHRCPVYLNRAAWLPGTLDAQGRPVVTRVEDWLSMYRPRTKRDGGRMRILRNLNNEVMKHFPMDCTFVSGPAGSRRFAEVMFGDDPVANLVPRLFRTDEDYAPFRNGHDRTKSRDIWTMRATAAYALQMYLLICYGSTLFDGDPDPELGKSERMLYY